MIIVRAQVQNKKNPPGWVGTNGVVPAGRKQATVHRTAVFYTSNPGQSKKKIHTKWCGSFGGVRGI